MDYSVREAKSVKTSKLLLSEYAKKLDQQVKKRYVEKIAAIVIDPVLLTPEKKHWNRIAYHLWRLRIF